MTKQILDIKVVIPEVPTLDPDVVDVTVTDSGRDDPAERATFVHFYATALAVLLEKQWGGAARALGT
jgi:hypothetical protein